MLIDYIEAEISKKHLRYNEVLLKMTLTIAWIRQSEGEHELVFASDSRLTGGGHVDQCQKVFALPREDCCIAFAGSTMIAYPFILQLGNVITQYQRSFDREVDIQQVKSRVLSLLNFFVSSHENFDQDSLIDDLNSTSFLFGGWSWSKAKFFLWKICYQVNLRRYIAIRVDGTRPGRAAKGCVAAIGDYLPEFYAKLQAEIADEITVSEAFSCPVRLNYQPLTVLSRMLSQKQFTKRGVGYPGKIGGAPQVVAVYPFLRTRYFAVEWDIKQKFVYAIKGRIIADFELFSGLGLNPFTGEKTVPLRGRNDDNIDISIDSNGDMRRIFDA